MTHDKTSRFYPPIFKRDAPLLDRLLEARDRVSEMSRDRQAPRMQIPATANCDDVFICDALMEAATELIELRTELSRLRVLTDWIERKEAHRVKTD